MVTVLHIQCAIKAWRVPVADSPCIADGMTSLVSAQLFATSFIDDRVVSLLFSRDNLHDPLYRLIGQLNGACRPYPLHTASYETRPTGYYRYIHRLHAIIELLRLIAMS